MSPKVNTQYNKATKGRLLSYATAAGVGAFGAGVADAGIVFFDIPDVTLSTVPPDPDADFEEFAFIDVETGAISADATGANEIVFRARYREAVNQNVDGSAGAGDLFVAGAGVEVLAPNGGDAYYIAPFYFGDEIGPITPSADGYVQGFLTYFPYQSGPYVYSGGSFDGFVGFRFSDGGGGFRFGWAEVETNGGGSSFAELTIKAIAIETDSGTPIAAGAVPEPTTLALLALGAGGLACRRTRE